MLPVEYIKWYDHYNQDDESLHAFMPLSERINRQDYDVIFHSVGFVAWENATKICIVRNLRSELNDPDLLTSQNQVIYKALIIERTRMLPEGMQNAGSTITSADEGNRSGSGGINYQSQGST